MIREPARRKQPIMKFSIRHCVYAAVAVVSAAAATPFVPLAAQATREFETRAQLEAAAQEATAARKDAEAYRIRLRLSEGDFYPGDRIVVRIDGPAPFTDTVTVAAGKKITLPQMGDFSLAGVLRSEVRSLKTIADFRRARRTDVDQTIGKA